MGFRTFRVLKLESKIGGYAFSSFLWNSFFAFWLVKIIHGFVLNLSVRQSQPVFLLIESQ